MNEPLKFKLFSVYGKILHKDVLTEAFRKVKKNKGCAGIIDMPATVLNVIGDDVSSMMVARIVDGKEWNKISEE